MKNTVILFLLLILVSSLQGCSLFEKDVNPNYTLIISTLGLSNYVPNVDFTINGTNHTSDANGYWQGTYPANTTLVIRWRHLRPTNQEHTLTLTRNTELRLQVK